jgi:hypothetical protein
MRGSFSDFLAHRRGKSFVSLLCVTSNISDISYRILDLSTTTVTHLELPPAATPAGVVPTKLWLRKDAQEE